MNCNKQQLWKSIVVSSFGSAFRGKLLNNVESLPSSQLSSIWKEILKIQKIETLSFVVGANSWKWVLGNGSKISFLYDPWIDNLILKDEFPALFLLCRSQNASVAHFLYPSDMSMLQTGWELLLSLPLPLYDSLKASDLQVLLTSYKLNEHQEDLVMWVHDSKGVYNVADGIRIILNSGNLVIPEWPKVVWNNNVPSKVALFHWLALKNSIPVRDVLSRRHILSVDQSTFCAWCLNEVETIDHLLMHCSWSSKIWTDLFRWWNFRWVLPESILLFSFDWYNGMGIKANKFWRLIGPATMWAIWIARNDYIFNGKYTCRSVIVCNIKLKTFL
ncbi:uncharacterized protein [Rutidosis leptorrhynchoides]|uniref:uncharacterized protein n=1 Tax=Rutidosis leptorrhynchoides TaxID=125765 RepID=UPI003A99013D